MSRGQMTAVKCRASLVMTLTAPTDGFEIVKSGRPYKVGSLHSMFWNFEIRTFSSFHCAADAATILMRMMMMMMTCAEDVSNNGAV